MKYVDIEVDFKLNNKIMLIKNVNYDNYDVIMDILTSLQDIQVIKTIKVVFNGK